MSLSRLIVKIGIIQTRGIGDIIIAIPIAAYFIRQNCEVFWPVDKEYLKAFSLACPAIHFIPIDSDETGYATLDYFVRKPAEELVTRGCNRIFSLYHYLTGMTDVLTNTRYAESLKFDEYKYAVTGVPFGEKWNLHIERNHERERALYDRLNISRDYIVVHNEGSNVTIDLPLSQDILDNYQIVTIAPITTNPFDWLFTLENAAMLYLIDSCFANLVEQLDIGRNRHFIFRQGMRFTPVLKNRWMQH